MSHRFRFTTADIWPNPWSMYRTLRDHEAVHHVVPANQPEDDYYVLPRHADVWSMAMRSYPLHRDSPSITATWN